MVKYLSNAELLKEIHASKSTYCSFMDDDDRYDRIVHDLTEVEAPTEGLTVRLMTWDHVPAATTKRNRSRVKGADGRLRTIFPPFQHWRYQEGEWKEIGRSHWTGGLHNGHFSQDHGRITNNLAKAWMLLVERYGLRPNFRNYSYLEDMKSEALQQLCHTGLTFNEARSDNPFSYYTQTVYHAFLKTLKPEARLRDIRDDFLSEAGLAPSFHRQADA